MKSKDIASVEFEANRVLARIKEYRERHGTEDHPYGSAESGALRRASLDLSRALSKMRKCQTWYPSDISAC